MRGPMRLCLAGPMQTVPEFNHPAFNAAAKRLRSLGYTVFNPAEFPSGGHLPDAAEDAAGFDVHGVRRACFDHINRFAQAVVVLDGWTGSEGARAEVLLAQKIGVPVYSYTPNFAPPLMAAEATIVTEVAHIRYREFR